jgi:hypothetical protein
MHGCMAMAVEFGLETARCFLPARGRRECERERYDHDSRRHFTLHLMFSFPFTSLTSSNRKTSLDSSEAFATWKAGSLAMQCKHPFRWL